MARDTNAEPQRRRDRLPLGSFSRHLEPQLRGRTIPATINRYSQAMRSGEEFPPPLVADVHGALILVDGFHRCAAKEALGEEDAAVEVVPCASLEEAVWLGFSANFRHGQPLKARLLRTVFQAYVKASRHRKGRRGFKSYREIAAEIPGVSYSTIRRWMEKDFPRAFRAMGDAEGSAPGGLQSRAGNREAVLTKEALALLDDAEAVMGGVADPVRRQRVAQRAMALRLIMMGADEGPELEDLRAFGAG